MKIAVISCHTPALFWFRTDMMKAFAAKGCEVYALGNESASEWEDSFKDNGIIYRQIQVSRNGMNPLNDLKTLKSIKEELSKIMPDKIFTFQAKTVIYSSMAAAKLGISEVYPLIAGLGSLFLKDNFKTKLVRNLMMTEYRIALKKAKTVFFQNEDDLSTFKEYKVIKNQKVVMLHGSGVNTEHFAKTPLPEGFATLYIGRLLKDKGVFEYLEACRELKSKRPEARCMLVGPFDTNPTSLTKEELDKYINDGIIEYFGEQKDVRPYLNDCSVYVLPSYREGTPKTNLEAMSVGRPIITTNAPGCRETVKDGVNGFLVPVKDVNSITEKMIELMDNTSQAEEMAANGRKLAEDIFDVDKVNAVILETMGV